MSFAGQDGVQGRSDTPRSGTRNNVPIGNERDDAGAELFDRSGLEVLTEDECLALIGSTPIGRVVYSERALPVIVPVNFTLDGADVVVRTNRRSRLATVVPGNVVAFEVDEIDRQTRSGWSVVLTGCFELVESEAELARLNRLDVQSWAPSAHDRYLRMRADLVSGRRIPRADPSAAESDMDAADVGVSRRVAPAS